MTLLDVLFRRQPDTDEDEPEEEEDLKRAYQAQLDWERGCLGPVHARPLLWSIAPPTQAGNYYCRRPGKAEYILVQVQRGDEYRIGMQWAGPLPTPYEPKVRA